MNILVDIRHLMGERYSGVAEYTLQLLRHIIATDTANTYYLFYNSARDVSKRIPVFDYPNVRFIRRRYPNKLFNYAGLFLFDRPRLDKLAGVPIDLVFLPHLNFAAVSKNLPMIVTVHDFSFLRYPSFFSWRNNIWHRFVRPKRLVRRAAAVVAISESTRRDVIGLAGAAETSVRTIHPGLNPIFFRSVSAEELETVRQRYSLPERFVFMLGTVEPRKNVEGLIEAFEILKRTKAGAGLKLVIAGGRSWKSAPIYRAARRSSVAGDIVFLNYVAEADRPALYRLASLFVYPSFYEGFGLPPLEAMAAGTPTIVSAAASLPEVAGRGAILTDPYDPASIAAAMEEILADPQLAADLAVAGQAQAASFNWQTAADHYLALFREIASQ